jgi:hypothetical protein
VDPQPLIVRCLAAQVLSGPPAAGPVEVAERLLAIEAQDKSGFRLAVRARTAGQSVASSCGACMTGGPLRPADLRGRLAATDVITAGQAFLDLLLRASLDGLIVRGPVVGGEHRYALVADWLGPGSAVDRDAALAELARRYLRGHGPATERDLAAWAGVGGGARWSANDRRRVGGARRRPGRPGPPRG